MRSLVFKRAIVIDGQKTSVSLENEFWDGLREIARRQNVALSTLVKQIDNGRTTDNLSSAIRVFVFNYFYAFFSQRNFLDGGQRNLEGTPDHALRNSSARPGFAFSRPTVENG
jgi:predicted DNA-binding ribbon-helix-helix protein